MRFDLELSQIYVTQFNFQSHRMIMQIQRIQMMVRRNFVEEKNQNIMINILGLSASCVASLCGIGK